jgi:hypothetical protein
LASERRAKLYAAERVPAVNNAMRKLVLLGFGGIVFAALVGYSLYREGQATRRELEARDALSATNQKRTADAEAQRIREAVEGFTPGGFSKSLDGIDTLIKRGAWDQATTDVMSRQREIDTVLDSVKWRKDPRAAALALRLEKQRNQVGSAMAT